MVEFIFIIATFYFLLLIGLLFYFLYSEYPILFHLVLFFFIYVIILFLFRKYIDSFCEWLLFS